MVKLGAVHIYASRLGAPAWAVNQQQAICYRAPDDEKVNGEEGVSVLHTIISGRYYTGPGATWNGSGSLTASWQPSPMPGIFVPPAALAAGRFPKAVQRSRARPVSHARPAT